MEWLKHDVKTNAQVMKNVTTYKYLSMPTNESFPFITISYAYTGK